ncbi:unnamed protein product, partial [Meganyctiphanes norvegica]
MYPGWCLLLVHTLHIQHSVAQNHNHYCDFTSEHTLCKNIGLGHACGGQVFQQGVSNESATLILHHHNWFRTRVARGDEPEGAPGPQPQASNMRQMNIWQYHFLDICDFFCMCLFLCKCANCKCISRFHVGQNMAISSPSWKLETIEWPRAIQSWFDELITFNPNHIYPFQFSELWGHYTAMIWHDIWKIGCGYTMFNEFGSWKKLYTCNYGPSGNRPSEEVYLRGEPCSSCPYGTTCSNIYPGLCSTN